MMRFNRRQFLGGLAAVSVVAAMPLKWIKDHAPRWGWHIVEFRYYDHRLSNEVLEEMTRGVGRK